MAIVTLTTDWGLKDHYVASVKGSLLKSIPEVNIIDISHNINSFDTYQTSFVLKSSFRNFPDNTIHIIGVNSDASIDQPHLAVKCCNQYFIGADNGIFSMMFEKETIEIVELEVIQDNDKYTFSTKDVFIKAAKHLVDGKDFSELGNLRDNVRKAMTFAPVIEMDDDTITIIGKVIYIDRYENAITNISEDLFTEYVENKKFNINFNSFDDITAISKSYLDVPPGEICVLFDSNDLLEISINQGNAKSLLGLSVDTRVRVNIER